MSESPLEAIAIIGLTGRFPGASNLATFWSNLRDGVESISRFPELLRADDPEFVPARGVLENVHDFDASFFGLTPNEARITDPQQRLFLECAWEALEHAGYDAQRPSGAVGVYAGMSNNTYFAHSVAPRPDLIDAVGALTAMMGNEKDYIATRVAYKLNLKGPAISVHTACSTSLVAVCSACASLLSYQCDMALAGGVSITFPQERGYRYHEGGIVSPDGHCRSFDIQAAGTVFSHGAGVVVLKRLSEALADGDTIHAVIRGSALNNDGAGKVSFTAPSVDGHAEVIALAQALAGVDPRSISYIEAHGTATPLGDPIEIAGLTQAFRVGTDDIGFCRIGSVKSNIGHLDAAAGIAGLIKTVLALKHKELPASLHFETPNPKLDLEHSPFVVNTSLTPWESPDGEPRRAGVSSFGVGGTNAHVVLEEAPDQETVAAPDSPQLLIVSAKTAAALDTASANLADFLENAPEVSLADVSYTLAAGRQSFAFRRVTVASTAADAIAALRGESPKQVFSGQLDRHGSSGRRVAFVFPGQGVQSVNMCRGLYDSEPVFREIVDACCAILRPHLGLDLRGILYPETGADIADAQKRLTETWLTQPSLFVVEYALAKLWESRGIVPDALLGHSVGEYAAACFAGVFSPEDALLALAARARLMQDLPAGAMLAVRRPEADVAARLSPDLALAAVNAPSLCVVAGSFEAIEAFETSLTDEKITHKRLATSHAFHSAMMEPILDAYAAKLATVEMHAPQIPIVSSRTGDWLTDDEARDPSYWTGQLRETVRFHDALSTLFADDGRLALEVGPGQTLSALARQCAARRPEQPVIASLAASGSDLDDLTALLFAHGQFWLNGITLDTGTLFATDERRRLPLPTYPFERQTYAIDPPAPAPQTAPPMLAATTQESMLTHTSATPMAPQESASSTSGRFERLRDTLLSSLHELSGIAREQLSPDVTLVEMGFDSLFLTQASQAFGSKFGVKITFRRLIEDLATINELAAYLDKQLPPEPEAPAAPVAVAPVTVATMTTPAPVAAAPAPVSFTSVSPVSAGGSDVVERVIQQQLALMAQQLAALQGAAGTASGAGSSNQNPTPVPPLAGTRFSKKQPHPRPLPWRAVA